MSHARTSGHTGRNAKGRRGGSDSPRGFAFSDGAKDPAIGNRLINARSEAAGEKPAFRKACRLRRCIVPADGFFEWMKLEGGGRKQPYWIARKDGAPLGLAGLWESWTGEGETIESFTVLTTDANDAVKDIHNRMPVILLEGEAFARWLDLSNQDYESLRDLLKPVPSDQLHIVPVSTRVNSPRNDDADCVKPIAETAATATTEPRSSEQKSLFD